MTTTKLSSSSKWDINLDDLLPSLSDMYTDGSIRDVPSNRESSEAATLLDRSNEEEEIAFDSGVVHQWKPRTRLDYISAPFKKVWQGPATARDNPPRPIQFLQPLEDFPYRVRELVPRPIRILGLSVYLFLWFVLCYSILIPYLTVPPANVNDPLVVVVPISCLEQANFWNGKNGACGFNGELCPSWGSDAADVVFRCPALCDRGSYTFSLVPIGDQLIKYRGYYVGGGVDTKRDSDSEFVSLPYRADSFPCGAAIHSGTISPFFGGCTRIKYTGGQPSFASTKGAFGVDVSIPFLSFFQSSFRFTELGDSYLHCYDPRLLILFINVLLGLPIVYLASGGVTFWTITTVGFWTIALATDPPRTVDASDFENFADLISLSLGRFLPTGFILYVLWHTSVKRTLVIPRDEDEVDSGRRPSVLYKLILFYPFFWLGVLNNVTFDRLPVDRLTILDIQSQLGAIFAVGGILSVIIVCAIIQAYKIWLSGRFRKYLLLYILFITGLVLVSLLPGLILRIHHYILAILLIPGCSTRGRTALMFQGILLGLFLLGASRWGLAAIAETIGSLKRNDPQGTVYPPIFQGFDVVSGLLSWKDIDKDSLSAIDKKLLTKYNGYSILINDIERFVDYTNLTFMNLTDLFRTESGLGNLIQSSLDSGFKDKDGNIPIYLRIGRKILGSSTYSDFSKAAVLKWPSGEFVLPEEGVT